MTHDIQATFVPEHDAYDLTAVTEAGWVWLYLHVDNQLERFGVARMDAHRFARYRESLDQRPIPPAAWADEVNRAIGGRISIEIVRPQEAAA